MAEKENIQISTAPLTMEPNKRMEISARVLAGIYTLTCIPDTPTTLNGPRKYTARLTLSLKQVIDQPIDAYKPIYISRLLKVEAKVVCWV
jgi:hypothetical protein